MRQMGSPSYVSSLLTTISFCLPQGGNVFAALNQEQSEEDEEEPPKPIKPDKNNISEVWCILELSV